MTWKSQTTPPDTLAVPAVASPGEDGVMLPLLKRHEIQVLRRAGVPQERVAELAGVSLSTVHRVEHHEAPVQSVDDAQARRARRIGRPDKAEPYRDFVVELLGREPELLTVEVLRRARLRGYAGGKSALYVLVAQVRPRPVRPVTRFEGLPGEFTQHDFGEVDVRWGDGSTRRVHFFASRFKYSRWVEVSLVADQRVESLVRALVEHFARVGGVPLCAVFDRPRTVAIAWSKDGTVTQWNATFGQVMLELGVAAEACWPYQPQQKGAVENLVGWVKGSFFKQRRFVDEDDLRRQLGGWLREVNTERPSRATGVIPAARLDEERPRLRPLKVTPETLALRIPIVVGPTAMVPHEGGQYSMPPEAIGISGTLFLHRDRVRIVAGRFTAEHRRLTTPGATSLLPEHRAQHVAAVSGKRGRRYLKRQHLLELGAPAVAYLTEVTHRRPQAAAVEVERLHELLQRHGDGALRRAFAWAVAQQRCGVEYIAHYLEQLVPAGVQ